MLCGPRRAVICAAVSRWRGRLSNKGEHIWLHAVRTLRIDPPTRMHHVGKRCCVLGSARLVEQCTHRIKSRPHCGSELPYA